VTKPNNVENTGFSSFIVFFIAVC